MTRPNQHPEPPNTFRADLYDQEFSVRFDYPVYFARRVFDADNSLLAGVVDRHNEQRRHRVAVYVDSGLAEAHPRLPTEITEYFHRHPPTLELAGRPTVVPGGEAAKTGWEWVRDLMSTMGNLHLDRQSCILAVGGGAMLDMVGFATAIVHRGLRLIRVPTTTLSQNDGGVGVKNGMNEHGMKNFVGTFAPPFAVINDFTFLSTLSQRDWIGGAAEAFKVAILEDPAFFDFLCENAAALRDRRLESMEALVRRCAILHLLHIRGSGDPFEFGSARPLDFGHWAAHWLEVASAYAIGHGQAVAIGIALDSFYAMRQNLITPKEFDRIVTGLLNCGLPVWCEHLSTRSADGELSVLEGLAQFREHLGGPLSVTLPNGIGRKVEVHHLDAGVVEEAVDHLKTVSGGG
jgi:3-dehydroquinate synthase